MTAGIRTNFAAYLRERRNAVPVQARAAGSSRRQVPGLRRQELAEAAGISIEYYIRLEQGRAPRPSREVLGALTRALGLSSAEAGHLFRLAGELPPEPAAPGGEIRPGLLRMLEGLDDSVPVTVHDGRLDLLARNAAAADLLGPLPVASRWGRSIVHQGFAPGARAALGSEGAARYARWATAELRSALGRYPDDPRLGALRDELTATSSAFRGLWAEGEVAERRSAVKRVRHPSRGWLTFQSEMLHDDERDHWIVIYAPA